MDLVRRVVRSTRGPVGESDVEAVLEVLCTALGACGAVVWTRGPDGSWRAAHRTGGCGTTDRDLRRLVAREGGGAPAVWGLPADAGHVLVRDLDGDADGDIDGNGEVGSPVPGADAAVAAPLGPVDEPVGVLDVYLAEESVTETTVHAVEVVAALLGARAEQQRLLDSARRERDRLATELGQGLERDALTRLPDRTALCRRLEASLEEADRGGGSVLLAVLDLHRFETVNDRFGAAGGDALLVAVADRLRDAVRHTSLARLGGDTFAVLLAGEDVGEWDAEDLGRHVSGAFDRLFEVQANLVSLDVTVGVAGAGPGADPARNLLHDAELALRAARSSDGTGRQVFHPAMHHEALERLALEADLRRAVEEGQIEVAYQPIVDLTTGRMTGVEALARWHRPGCGPVSPGVFIPAAERQGLIGTLGSQVLLRACQQVRVWRDTEPAATELELWVNVAAAQLDDPDLVPTVTEAVARSGLEPTDVVLEITESTVARDAPSALARLWELRRTGVGLAIDDFGTGWSSLARLRDLPADHVKIDRSFLRGIAGATVDAPLVGALLGLARTLDLRVVAEGVETAAQLAAVLRHDCEAAQGHLLGRAVEPEVLARLLADPTWDMDELTPPDAGVDLTVHERLAGLLRALAEGSEAPGEALDEVLAVLADAAALDAVYLTRVDWQAQRSTVVRAWAPGPVVVEEGLQAAWSRTLCREALTRDRPTLTDVEDPHLAAGIAGELGIRSYVGVPVPTPSGAVFGTLCGVSGDPVEVDDDLVATFDRVARMLGEVLPAPQPPSG